MSLRDKLMEITPNEVPRATFDVVDRAIGGDGVLETRATDISYYRGLKVLSILTGVALEKKGISEERCADMVVGANLALAVLKEIAENRDKPLDPSQ